MICKFVCTFAAQVKYGIQTQENLKQVRCLTHVRFEQVFNIHSAGKGTQFMFDAFKIDFFLNKHAVDGYL